MNKFEVWRFYSSKYFAQICRAQYEAAIGVYFCGTPTWLPQNGAIICHLLCLSRRLITCTEETIIYMSTFPSTLTSKMANYHEIRIYFLTNAFVALFHAPPYNSEIKMRWYSDEASY